jgi:hypothetical protein
MKTRIFSVEFRGRLQFKMKAKLILLSKKIYFVLVFN